MPVIQTYVLDPFCNGHNNKLEDRNGDISLIAWNPQLEVGDGGDVGKWNFNSNTINAMQERRLITNYHDRVVTDVSPAIFQVNNHMLPQSDGIAIGLLSVNLLTGFSEMGIDGLECRR